eukprot:5304379-Pyramimonas_sp.AAC.1
MEIPLKRAPLASGDPASRAPRLPDGGRTSTEHPQISHSNERRAPPHRAPPDIPLKRSLQRGACCNNR